jgi:hypothetical protein
MARRSISIDEKIRRQKEVVLLDSECLLSYCTGDCTGGGGHISDARRRQLHSA